jgi:hypothetical protein
LQIEPARPVEAREINPPANEEPLHWRLLTTIKVGDAAAAREIVRLYRVRCFAR